MSHIEDIYREQNNSFKLNMNLGFIMRNRKTGEYRYYIPYANSYLFQTPHTITRHGSLRALKNKIKKINPQEYVRNQRPGSEWEPVYITNIHFDISLMDYVLGHSTQLPDHVKNSKSVLTFIACPKTGKVYNDQLCFFRCLAWHESQSQVGFESLTHRKYKEWVDYTPVALGKKCLGVTLHDIPDLENCFQMNITVFQLLENKCVTVHYKSMSTFENSMYLDLQGNHLSYIQNIDAYAKRFQCPYCDRIFKRCPDLKRHYLICSKVTKLKFPGGFHQGHQTIYDELEKYGICVTKNDRIYKHFITYDFEAVLQKLNRDPSNKLVWEEKHVPISVGVGSNVEGFKDGVCYVSYDLDDLLSQMLEHMQNIAKKVKEMEKHKFDWVFNRLKDMIDSFKDTQSTSDHTSRVSPGTSKGASAMVEDNTAFESDDYEPPSKRFSKRVTKPNSFDTMIAHLQETDEIRTEFHDFTSDNSDLEEEEEDIFGDNDGENETTTERIANPRERFRRTMLNKIENLQARFDSYLSCVPVLGFNSSKYDLNLVKSKLCKHLELANRDIPSFTVKKNNSYLTICTPTLKFLDISHYIAPGYSYAQFLKSYHAQEKKSFFCYQYLSDPAVLEETELPPYQSFYSELKQCNVLEQEWDCWRKKFNVSRKTQDLEYHAYRKETKLVDSSLPYLDHGLKRVCLLCMSSCCVCQEKPESGPDNYRSLKKLWKECGMQTVKDFLVHYNLKDIDPFTEAVTNLQKFYFDNNINIFKDTISVPGAARQMLFKSKDAKFTLFDHENEDLYRKVKQNICGGPSIVFTRTMKAGQRLKDGEETCAKIFGFDANALYPYCLSQEMPCGTFVRRSEEEGYKPKIQTKYLDMYIWMDKLSEMKNIKILHKLNSGKEHYIMGFFVDGIHNNDIYEYHRCYVHGCATCTEKLKYKKSDKWIQSQQSKTKRTQVRKEYLESLGYNVHEIWECEFKSQFLDSTEAIRNRYMPKYYSKHKCPLTKTTLLKAIRSGELFGMAEVDIEVPDTWQGDFHSDLSPYDYFKEFSPLFCTTDVPFDSIGEHMIQHSFDHNAPTKSRRLLVGGMKAKQILLCTPLLQWYLKHGLVVTRLYEVIKFSPVKCFANFVQQGIDGRRQSDKDPNLALLGDTFKVLLNSSYGSC